MKMGRKVFVVSVLCLTLVFFTVLSSGVEAKEKKIMLKFSLHTPPSHTYSVTCKKILPMIEKATGGAVKVRLFTSGTLMRFGDVCNGIQNGVADISVYTTLLLSKSIPFFGLHTLPFVWRDTKGSNEAWNHGLNDIQEKVLIENGYDKVKVLGNFSAGMRYLITKGKQVKTFDDLRGMKIRTLGENEKKIMILAGGSTVYVSVVEMYEALERGIIDGEIMNSGAIRDYKHYEPCEYWLNLPIDQSTMQVIMNKDSYNKVPEKYKPILDAIFAYLVSELRYQTYAIGNYAKDIVMPSNMEAYTPTAQEKAEWRNKTRIIVNEWVKEVGPKGEEALKIVKKYNFD